jgi:hypothetical protein
MRAAQVRQHPPLRLELRVPALQLLPGIQLDPLQAFTGRSLAELLTAVLEGPPWTQQNQTCYHIALADGVGLSLPLGGFGEVGLHHAAGQIQVTAPALAAMFLQSLPHQVGGPEIVPAPGARLSRYTLALPVGAAVRLPLGTTSVEVLRRS